MKPPSVDLALNGIANAVTPIAKLPILCHVDDDYKVETLRSVLLQNPDTSDSDTDDETRL